MSEIEYTDVEIRKSWEDLFAREDYRRKLTELASKFPDERSLNVDFRDIEDTDLDFSVLLLNEPDRCLGPGTQVIRDFSDVFGDERYRVNLRISHLPQDAKIEIRHIRARHLGKLIAVDGMARKVTGVNPRAVNARFTCAKCGQEIWVPQHGTVLARPMACPNPMSACNKSANSFILDEINSIYIDSQFVEVQESPDGLRGGQQPERKTCYIDDDLCGLVTTGNRITVNGIVRSVEKKDNDKTTLFETYIQVLSVDFEAHEFEVTDITEEDEKAILAMSRDKDLFQHLVESISPTIHGLTEVKEAIVLQLFGGCHKRNDDGSSIRGDMHILLVGDPGVAKSQILRYMTDLAPHSIYASGKSASGAGLTAAVVKDSDFGDGRWNLEAGALVLADGGLACIDELDKMSEQDTSSLHEAMESQRISFAKAGITAVLQCRCSILAAANPSSGKFIEGQPIASQIDLPPALKSRFDLIFALTDNIDEKNDRALADFIIGVHQRGEVNLNGGADAKISGVDVPKVMAETAMYKPYYDPELIRKYVAYSKRFAPFMTDKVRNMIVEEFVSIREKSRGGALPITARQLEAFVRLSEASARMRFSPKVEKVDADRAIRLVTYYLTKIAGDGQGGFDMSLLNTGISTTERNNSNFVDKIVTKIIKDAGAAGADTADIIREAEAEGIDEAAVRSFLTRGTNTGQLYSPKSGKYKLVNE